MIFIKKHTSVGLYDHWIHFEKEKKVGTTCIYAIKFGSLKGP